MTSSTREHVVQRVLAAALTLLPITPATAADTVPLTAIELYVGQVHLIRAGELKRVAVGNGKVIQATALDGGQVLVIPEAAGQSTLHLWTRDGGESSYAISVVPADANRLLAEIRTMLGEGTRVRARIVGDKVVLEGSELSEEEATRMSEIARRYPQVVNLISRVGLERMIEMDVRMLEVRRDVLEDLGVRWSGSMQGPSFGIIGDLHRSRTFRPGGAAADAGFATRARVAPFTTVLELASSITSVIHLLVQNGDAVVLAEPRLSCRSGGSARFVAGGELPVPFASGLGTVSVGFKEYGVKFDVSPVASETGVIAAKIATEISAINFEIQVQDVPGLLKRRAETEVNLRENETLVIAGLLTEESSKSIDRVPALGELPILGKLFRSREFRDRKTDLVVFITPRFVGGGTPAQREAFERSTQRFDEVREQLRMAE
ncbi:MAG: pilus assembly protein N-terminal domain-containing protein [Burkholderiaceae bacterium]|nr:pilus assembly protein N-terminal domain-containing protein [Burkholderiaceae bacterium]